MNVVRMVEAFLKIRLKLFACTGVHKKQVTLKLQTLCRDCACELIICIILYIFFYYLLLLKKLKKLIISINYANILIQF